MSISPVLLAYDLHYLLLSTGGFSVFAGVGERTREGNDLYREMIESGVIKLGDKQVNVLESLGVFLSCLCFYSFIDCSVYM